MEFEIVYRWDRAGDRHPTILKVYPNGLVKLNILSNLVFSNENQLFSYEEGGVGEFRHRFEPSQVAWLFEALASREFFNLDCPELFPGQAVNNLLVRDKGASTPKVARYFPLDSPSPPFFSKIVTKVRSIIKIVHQHPFHAMSIEVDTLPNRPEPRRPFLCSVSLVNIGSEQIKIAHPDQWSDIGIRFSMMGSRSDIDPVKFNPVLHQSVVALSMDKLVEEFSSKMTSNEIFLQSGERLKMTLKLRLDWQPGPYEISVFLGQFRFLKGKNRDFAHELKRTVAMIHIGR